MEFKKYPSIENSYRTQFIYRIKKTHTDFCCIINEKIHGASFCIIVSHDIKFGKRSGLIKPNEKFYSYHLITKYLNKIGQTFKKEIGNCIIYGELCGGYYPHPDVKKTNHTRVQKGVYYSPKTEFVIFDVWQENFLNPIDWEEICNQYNFLHAPFITFGGLDFCTRYPVDFQTKIPEKLGLPQIENNFAEGIVIKPTYPAYLPSGSRVILKKKNEKFSERKNVNVKKIVELTTEQQSQFNHLCDFINENRLRNVISKVGEIKTKDFGKLTGLFIKDILEEYGETDQKVRKELQKVSSNFIRERFMDIIDGEL